MKTSDAIRYFGTQQGLANALAMKQPSIALWGDYPPQLRQLQIEELTCRKLLAEDECRPWLTLNMDGKPNDCK